MTGQNLDRAGRYLGDPALELERLRELDRAGRRPELFLFFGHRAHPGTVGPWVLSQWSAAAFTVDGVVYPNAEVWMMSAKARLFGDQDALARLGSTADPKVAKAIGRNVRGFDQALWYERAYQLVVAGNLAKFGQNPRLAAFLASTGDATLVEASPYDRIWGIGLSAGDPRASSPLAWRGRNLLGFALTEVRAQFAALG